MSKQLPDELRHAFRALLRAATYLPDSVARFYIHNYTIHRFRSVADKIRCKNAEDSEKLIAKYHDHKRIARVWQTARQLERAGQNREAELKKALYYTYGRAGKRRRELVNDLLGPEESTFPEDQAAVEELINKPPEEDKPGQYQNTKLRAFMRSQRFHHPADSPRNKYRYLEPQVPKESIWGRPIPLKRQTNIKKAYWADTLDKLMPPVPRYEWDRLRDLATGAIAIEEPPARRSRGLEADEPDDLKLMEYFSIPANRQKLDIEGIEVTEDSVRTHWEKRPIAHERGLRNLTPRYMRRLYATIWSMTPTMSQNEATKIWTTSWGGPRSAAYSGQVTAPSASDMELFEGADEQVKAAPAGLMSKAAKRMVRKRQIELTSVKPSPKGPTEVGYTQGIVPAI